MNQQGTTMSTLFDTSRPEFLERLGRLAGRSTYREPVGRGTKHDWMPDEHAIAAALAFARKDRDDFGPDVAYCWALGSDAYRNRVCTAFVDAVAPRSSDRVRGDLMQAVQSAWDALVHNRTRPKTADVDAGAWDAALLLAIGTLQESAWSALYRAERAYRKNAA